MRIDQPDSGPPDTPRPNPADASGESPADASRPGQADRGAHTADAGHVPKRPEATVSREAQLAEHARYRKSVEAAFQAAADRNTWAQAVPELRAAWASHQRKYPERLRASPDTQPDGSWVSGEHRRLDPEQNTEASKAHADLADEADRYILPALQRIEAADPNRHLAGLEHLVKGEDRLKEKLADVLLVEPRLTARQAVDKVSDAVRSTLTYSSDRYADGVAADIDRLKAEGFELVKVKNLWHADQYKGINTQWRMPETATRFEMQFHTPESLEAKELTHEAYERLRRPESETSQSERDELETFQRRANELVAIPPRVDSIKDFPEKKR
jgi:hypothetical protein